MLLPGGSSNVATQPRSLRAGTKLPESSLPFTWVPRLRSSASSGVGTLHPFGQIPTFEDGDLALFESGAIIFHLAERHAGLLPTDANNRARAIAWMFAALNTVEPPIIELEQAPYLEREKSWFDERLPMLEARVRARLDDLSRWLGDAGWLDGGFSAGDLIIIMVLRRLDGTGIVGEYPNLSAYVARGHCAARLQARFRGSTGGPQERVADEVMSDR